MVYNLWFSYGHVCVFKTTDRRTKVSVSDHLIHPLLFFCSPLQVKCPNYCDVEMSFLSPLLCFIETVLWFIYMCYIDFHKMLANKKKPGFSLQECDR